MNLPAGGNQKQKGEELGNEEREETIWDVFSEQEEAANSPEGLVQSRIWRRESGGPCAAFPQRGGRASTARGGSGLVHAHTSQLQTVPQEVPTSTLNQKPPGKITRWGRRGGQKHLESLLGSAI